MHDRRPRRQRWALLAGLTMLLVLSGCPNKDPKNPTCASDDDCAEGLHCVNQTCLTCGDDSHCPAGQRCVSGGCVAGEGDGTDPNGCTSDDQCAEGEVCQDGVCRACESDGECGPGGRCQQGVCDRPKACDEDTDCADDEDCIAGRCQKPWLGERPDVLDCELNTVYFDFDQAVVRDDARDILAANAECLAKAPATTGVYVSGHTDQQGTEEYNIALSERRAQAVVEYLARLGVDLSRLQTIARGETVSAGGDPAQDRRVEFEWR